MIKNKWEGVQKSGGGLMKPFPYERWAESRMYHQK
jgi:hypothetical protein